MKFLSPATESQVIFMEPVQKREHLGTWNSFTVFILTPLSQHVTEIHPQHQGYVDI